MNRSHKLTTFGASAPVPQFDAAAAERVNRRAAVRLANWFALQTGLGPERPRCALCSGTAFLGAEPCPACEDGRMPAAVVAACLSDAAPAGHNLEVRNAA